MSFITDLKTIKENAAIWGNEFDSFKSGQRLLDR